MDFRVQGFRGCRVWGVLSLGSFEHIEFDA